MVRADALLFSGPERKVRRTRRAEGKSRGFSRRLQLPATSMLEAMPQKKENERENNTDRGHRTRFDSYFNDGRPI